VNRIFHEMRWEPRAVLVRFDFVEGDARFLQWLAGYTGSDDLSNQTDRPLGE
jgi:hypothetical protein